MVHRDVEAPWTFEDWREACRDAITTARWQELLRDGSRDASGPDAGARDAFRAVPS